MNDSLRLNAVERDSMAWQKVAMHAEAQLEKYRAICENPTQTEQNRFAAAVRIHELKQLLELAKPASQKDRQEFAD